MKPLTDRYGAVIKPGDKVKHYIPLCYLGLPTPDPIIGVIIEEDSELIYFDGKYKTLIRNFSNQCWEIIR